ncbi:MAG: hypothetical protein ACOC97_03245 [Myxococcota bacterium]
MRVAAYVAMVALVVWAVIVGDIALALAIGGTKTLVVGLEFMELRHAARPHLIGFGLGTVVLTVLLVALA